MKRRIFATVVLLAVTLLGACSPVRPTYSTVRDETVAALETIAELIPEPKVVHAGAEQDPYSCSDSLLPSRDAGSFYTGHWTADVPDTFDVAAFVNSLPALLGEEWVREDLGIAVSFATVDLRQTSTGVSLTVEDHSADGSRVIDFIAISRCGVLGHDE